MELTLIVAATRNMGIGLNGSLPWSGLKKEMAYFARITKRLPANMEPPAMNAVIMGRKTWESIPPKFRPLKGRLNIVISRSKIDRGNTSDTESQPTQYHIRVASLVEALGFIESSPPGTIGRAFVIGGGQIYGAALGLPQTRRILLTSIVSDFECDTSFPLQLTNGDGSHQDSGDDEWSQSPKEKLHEWAGEQVPTGPQEENGTLYEFQMWERSQDNRP